MKSLLITIAMLSAVNSSYAQWINVPGTDSYYLNSGNVGIGTTNPSEKLQVSGRILANYLGLNGNLGINSAVDSRIYLQNTTPGTGSNWNLISDTDGSFSIGKYGSNPFQTITANGNVGVGTTGPNAKLHVFGTVAFSGSDANLDPAIPSRSPSFLANTGQIYIGWNRTSGGGETDFISNQGGGGIGGFAFYNYANNGTESQLMWLQANGNVGIGTTDPAGYKLAVNGTIHSKEVKVDLTGWSDYVFKPTYKLPKLSEVKAYIDQNQHLPEMPSATEVEKDGVNLGEMVKLQTKKIEELTLYLIEKDKKDQDKDGIIQNQQIQINQLKQLMNALTAEIHKN